MSTTVHGVAHVGFAAGTNELYDRARPSYPQDSVRFIKKAVDNARPLNIVEIGAGTGLFTRTLLSDEDNATRIASLKAIEPSAGMREVFKQRVSHESVSISDGTFDNVPSVENGWADLIIIAQAFHWCPDYGRACAEFARILKPGGAVAFIWNLENRDAAGWVAQLRDRIEIHESGSPQFRLGLWRQAFSTEPYNNNFKPPEEKEWVYQVATSEEICIDRALSKSYISILPPDQKQSVIEDINAIVTRGDGKVWIDESKGVFEYPYRTLVVLARKK
ncbi:S-adenosyl-L-methionine-dependent methyltransferase [Boletus reticuloceps]|uniref:S-adenosyl-L-methionine-dependent methyltransferase n=1 Tax=Boletus reticuloceps TaxID=495285 RepID=A0A8I3A3H2_9AGAM|nr:S-adenosyl-L-methionine-dependent methyltransferase [Boletus reticuloceps]